MRKRLTTLIMLLLLAGCGSSPKTHFYTLSVAPTGGRHAISFPVQLTAVHVPPSLDREQLVRMSGANSVKISDTDRWSASFGQLVRNVLAQDLAARLSNGRFILPEAPAPAGTAALVVTITQFGADANGVVRLTGSWALVDAASGTPRGEHNFNLNGGVAPGADAMAAAMSELLGRLAGQIAARLAG